MIENLKSLVVRIATLLKQKVDKVSGKSLVSDSLITKLEGLEKVTSSKYLSDNKLQLTLSDNTTVVTTNTIDLSGYVQKETGKSLIENTLKNQIPQKVDKVNGKGLLKSTIATSLETNWENFEKASKKFPTALAITGTDTKKIVLTLNDSTTLESQWVDLKGETVDFSGAGFDKTTGVFKINSNTQFSLDGRYRLLTAKIPWSDVQGAPTIPTLPSWVGNSKPTYNWAEIQNKPSLEYLPLTGGTINPGNVSNYQEGIRINKATNNWSTITLGTEGTSGIQSGAWAITRNPSGEFQIGTTSDANSGFRLSSDTAYWKGSRIATDAIIKSYDKYYGRSKNNLGHLSSIFSGPADYYKPHTIFTLSEEFRPTETTLGNMYGIGYTVGDNNPNSLVKPIVGNLLGSSSEWGLYGVNDGQPKWFLSNSGHIIAEKGFAVKDGTLNMFPTLAGGVDYLGKNQITTIDLTDLPQDKYYLAYFIGNSHDRFKTTILNSLYNSGYPSWKTHAAGFSIMLEFEYTGGGSIDPQLRCTKYTVSFASAPPAIKLGHAIEPSCQYVYLRGGGKYSFYSTSIRGEKVEWSCDKQTSGMKVFNGGAPLEQCIDYNESLNIIPADFDTYWKASYGNKGVIRTIRGFETYDLHLSTDGGRVNIHANPSTNELNVASDNVSGAYTKVRAKGYKAVSFESEEKALLSNGEVGSDPFIDRMEQHQFSDSNINSFRNVPSGMYRVSKHGEGGCMAVFRTNSSASAIFLYAPTFQNHRLRYNWSIDQNRYGSTFRELAYLDDVRMPSGEIAGNWDYTVDWMNNLIYVINPCNVNLNNLENFTGLSFINLHNGTTTFSANGINFIYLGAPSFQGNRGTSCTVNRRHNEIFVHVNKI